MTINSLRFGKIDIDEGKIIRFPQGLPGLEELQSFALIYNEDTQPINWLQAIEQPEISLPVIDPFRIMPDYAFDILQQDVDALFISKESDIHVVSVLVIPEDISKMTINLAAPIIINIKLHIGKQIIIDSREYMVKMPVFELLDKYLKEVRSGAGADEKGE